MAIGGAEEQGPSAAGNRRKRLDVSTRGADLPPGLRGGRKRDQEDQAKNPEIAAWRRSHQYRPPALFIGILIR
jgi:hypothetical protein